MNALIQEGTRGQDSSSQYKPYALGILSQFLFRSGSKFSRGCYSHIAWMLSCRMELLVMQLSA